jgi:MFS family permease
MQDDSAEERARTRALVRDESAEGQPQPRAFTAVAFVFVVVMMGTTLPSPLFDLYERTLGISPLMVTVLYAIYAFGVVVALLLAMPMSARLGRRPMLATALAVSGAAALAFLLSDNVIVLLAARVLSGLAAGAVTGTATESLILFGGAAHRGRSAMMGIGANMVGLALGTAVAGGVADIGYRPLQLPFIVDCGLVVLACAVLASVPKREGPRAAATGASLHPRALASAIGEVRAVFVPAAIRGGLGFAANGLIPSVTAVFLSQYLGIGSHLAAGSLISLVFLATALGQLLARGRVPHVTQLVGTAGLVVALLGFAAAVGWNSLILFVLATVLIGVSTGICIGAGIAHVAEVTPIAHRPTVVTAYFVLLYLLLAVPVIGFGVLLDYTTLHLGTTLFSALGIAVLLVTLLRSLRRHQSFR